LIPFISIAFEAGSPVRARLGRLARLIAGAALPVLPYLLFNLATAGTIWPSTFYAKQAEYAGLRRASIVARFARVSLSPLVGAGILLLPGAVLAAAAAVRSRRFGALGPLLWAGVYLTTFAFLLPVTYQHGRYQIPVVPVLVLLGWEGVAQAASEATTALRRLLTRAWAASVLAATLAFFVLGARAYATDVAVIETEMVEAARWIASHTEPGALVAAHDIGALGFYGERPILDLAGLAEADVIPFLRDEARLAQYLSQRGAAYLMTFPGWYPSLVACAEPVYVSNGGFSPMQGGEHMHIYGWPASPFIVPEGCMLYSPPPDGAASTDDE
jgi:hypothetical protein